MNIHIGCPRCGFEWEDKYIGSGLVDISEVHGAEILAKEENLRGAVKLVRIEEIYLILTAFKLGPRKETHCKVVDKEKATSMFDQAVTDVLTGFSP